MRRMLRNAAGAASVLLLVSGLFIITAHLPALAPPVPFSWQNTGGGAGFIQVNSFAYDPVRDVLYAGTEGAGVWRCDAPGSATPVWNDTGIDATANIVNCLAYDSVHDYLYAATTKGIWFCENPSTAPSWTQPIYSVTNCPIDAVIYDGMNDALYFGWYDSASFGYQGIVRCDNPSDPSRSCTTISEGTSVHGYRIDSFAYDSSRNMLYAGCTLANPILSIEDGKGVWRCTDPDSAPSWSDTGTGTIDSCIVNSLAYDPVGDLLYAGTEGSGVWRCGTPSASPSWTDMGGGFGSTSVKDIAYDSNNNALYAGGLDGSGVRQCLTPDTAPDWGSTDGNIKNYDIFALAHDPYHFMLYADCYDPVASTKRDVYRASVEPGSHWYFAEGYTGAGFQEWLCLGNPKSADISARVVYLFPDGISQSASFNISAKSRITVDVNAAAGPDRDVSMLITSTESELVAERPLYFSYRGQWAGGHNTMGARETSVMWYFAEGYTGAGFDEWICVLNPGGSPTNLTFRFQTQEEGEKTVEGFSVPAHSRASFKANDLLGGAYQTSLKLESTTPVVAERPMYFSYSGTGGWGWTGGHCVMGASSLADEYYFAEGTTRVGFEEWLTIQNPGITAIDVQATYMLGTGDTVDKTYPVPAAKRSTIFVPDEVGEDRDVSVQLTCASPFLAERPMYFDYQGMGGWGWQGGHCVIGATAKSTLWFLAEGYTGPGFEEWICMQNPGTLNAPVKITYYPEGGGEPIVKEHTVPASSRYTISVNADAGSDLAISARILSYQGIIVERPMYFDYNGTWRGGHDAVGINP